MSTAPRAEQHKLLALADLDTSARQLAHRRRSLPELSELDDLAARSRRLADEQAQARTNVSDLERAVRKAEADVEQVRTRAARDTERLNSGTGSAKDLTGLQHELTSLARRQAELEDVELEVMEQLEAAQSSLDALTAQLAEVASQQADATSRRDAGLAQIDAENADVTDRREVASAAVGAELLALYERIRQSGAGVGAAALTGARCGACRVEFSAAELSAIRHADPDEVVQCEECRAILVRGEA